MTTDHLDGTRSLDRRWTFLDLHTRMIPPRLVDTTLETVSNDMLFEDLPEYACIDKEPGWCEALRRIGLLNMVGHATLGLTSKRVKGLLWRIFLRRKTAVELATRLDHVRTERAYS